MNCYENIILSFITHTGVKILPRKPKPNNFVFLNSKVVRK